jgi:hypothetical protein
LERTVQRVYQFVIGEAQHPVATGAIHDSLSPNMLVVSGDVQLRQKFRTFLRIQPKFIS